MFTLNKLLSASSASKKLLLGSSRKTRIVSASALLLAVCAFGAAGVAPMAPDADDLPIKSITQELQLPHLADQIAALDTLQQNYISEERVRSGDTLATLLNRLGVDDADAANFIKSDAIARNVMQLKAGKRVQVQTTEDGELNWLSSTVGTGAGNLKNIEIRREGKGFKATEKAIALEKRIEMRSGEIRSSLFAATDAAQIPDNVASQIVDMFSTNIDFGSDLRRGDRFNVVYETFWQNGEYVYAGRVLAGEFMNGPATYQSVWFDDPSVASSGGYYGFDGKSLKKAFLKSPLEFSRISSGFSVRKHPISGLWKAHRRRRRSSDRHAYPRFRRWRDRLRWHPARLRQCGHHQALVQVLDRLCTHEPLRYQYPQRHQSQPGSGHRLCRHDRLVDRPAPAL
jgi:murein DD-endopeptidase MepM/ murein hydrolase activator NlpD